jgi:hypothetical protein
MSDAALNARLEGEMDYMTCIAEDRADWLLDAIATSTQDRRYLRGEKEYDAIAGDSILLNGKKAISVAIARATTRQADRIAELERGLATEREITANLTWAIEQLQSEKRAQFSDDGSCIRCGGAPRDATGICATCADEHAETPPTIREALERAEWWLSSHQEGRAMAEVCRAALMGSSRRPDDDHRAGGEP